MEEETFGISSYSSSNNFNDNDNESRVPLINSHDRMFVTKLRTKKIEGRIGRRTSK